MCRYVNVMAAVAVFATAWTAGCGADQDVSTDEPSGSSAGPSAVSFADIVGQYPEPPPLTDSGNADAPVRGCVNVSGSPTRAVLDIADCSSPRATYRVIQRVVTPDQCIADADRPFYYRDAQAAWTACLDINWDSLYCIDLGAVVAKVSCDDPNAVTKAVRTAATHTRYGDSPSAPNPSNERKAFELSREQIPLLRRRLGASLRLSLRGGGFAGLADSDAGHDTSDHAAIGLVGMVREGIGRCGDRLVALGALDPGGAETRLIVFEGAAFVEFDDHAA